MAEQSNNLAARWCRVGILFNVTPAKNHEPLDLEQLLVDTALRCPGDPRLFIAAATWLTEYSALVAAHRLKRLASEQLDADGQATLGLLIETAIEHGARKDLGMVITPGLQPASKPGPLFEVDRDWFQDCAEAEATDSSKRWGRWCQPIKLKPEILRPTEWILASNPVLRERADRKDGFQS